MKSIQRIILWSGCLAVILLANSVRLQAQTPYTGGDLSISDENEVPSNITMITTISGDLSLSGTRASFPDFAALKVVEGHTTINDMSTPFNNIFPVLDSILGSLTIRGNNNIQTMSGFNELDSVGENVNIRENDALEAISGFETLANIGGDFIIDDNDALTTLPTFVALKRIGSRPFYSKE